MLPPSIALPPPNPYNNSLKSIVFKPMKILFLNLSLIIMIFLKKIPK